MSITSNLLAYCRPGNFLTRHPTLEHIRLPVMHGNFTRTLAMKSFEKFKENVNFVKPLYRKVKFGNRVQPTRKSFVSVDVSKPYGNGIYVKRKIVTGNSVDYSVIDINDKCDGNTNLPGACDRKYHKTCPVLKCGRNVNNFNRKLRKHAFATYNLSEIGYGKMEHHSDCVMDNNKYIQAKNSLLLLEKVPVSWLRVYPAPQADDESALSIVFRCLVCQFGLAASLILWTVLWVFIIHFFEGPYETTVSLQFEREQNQLVIDLATELRQITPVSPKWKFAIEKRIEDERQMTILAVGRGAKIHPGQFWDLSGTFLFCVYVMTALGFGAPVPHTTWGRTSAIIYAALAVPTHIYIMVQASTCLVANMEGCIERCKTKFHNKKPSSNGRKAEENKESTNCSGNSELIKSSSEGFRRKIARILSIFYMGRCIPAATVVYYAAGVVGFGVMRRRTAMDAVMFPLEFTTTGGLEQVESTVRILYGLYVEGAMMLLACALAAFRAHTSATLNYTADKYRLFTVGQTS